MTDPTPKPENAAGRRRSEQETIADDLLRGAGAIAEFVFGNTGNRRQVYHLAQKAQIPVFKMGSILCARRSRLIAWIEQQEANAIKDRP